MCRQGKEGKEGEKIKVKKGNKKMDENIVDAAMRATDPNSVIIETKQRLSGGAWTPLKGDYPPKTPLL